MDAVCIATTDGRAYYTILTRLKKAGIVPISLTPSEAAEEKCKLIITTRKESRTIKGPTVPIEDLDENPFVLKGQVLAKLRVRDRQELLVGIDPGSRIGVAVFFQNAKLVSMTLNSMTKVFEVLRYAVEHIPNSKTNVKIGDGAPRLSNQLASMILDQLKNTFVEIVDEKGTSSGRVHDGGLTRHQAAAARIAFRKGRPFRRQIS